MKKNLFGTDGIRGPIGTYPFTFEALPHLGKAIGAWAQTLGGSPSNILLAHDTRISASWVKAGLAHGMLLHPINLFDAGVLPTPALLQLMQKNPQQFTCGIVISASHNPYHDNGIKIMSATTGKISLADELAITELFYAKVDEQKITSHNQFGSSTTKADAAQEYANAIINLVPKNFLKNKKIVLDCAHGATTSLAPAIFKALGADVIALHNQPNGTNINEQCGALHLEPLKHAVLAAQADIGFAFDGDGDRVIAVNNEGTIKNGDDLLALLSLHPLYKNQATIVGTVMSNKGLERFLAHQNKKLLRTAVGDKHIAHELEQKHLMLGGEQSGHIILRDYLATGDGIMAALRTAETLILTDNMSMATFTPYPQIVLNLRVAHQENLQLSPYREIIAQEEQRLTDGRLLVRYSGTEPVLRIMAEATSYDEAQQSALRLSERLRTAII